MYYTESNELKKYQLVAGEIVIALTGGTIGKLAIVQEGLGQLYLNQRVGKFQVLNPLEFKEEYVYWIARSVQNIIKNLAWGAAIPNVSPKQIESIEFPFLPKHLQEGIIEFLNDLKNNTISNKKIYFKEEVECKIIEFQKTQFNGKILNKQLTHQLSLLKQLRQSFLREAMQGKIVPQIASEGHARDLLEKIKAEKQKLIAEKKIKKEKELPPITPEEIPFEIPENWVWCRLGELSLFSEAGNSFKCVEIPVSNKEWGVIKVSAISWDVFLEDKNKIYSKTQPDDIKAQINVGDFLISRANTSELVGKSVVVKSISKNLLLSDKTIRFKFSNFVSTDYVHLCNNYTKYARDYYALMGTGSSPSMKNITREHMRNLLIPLPPFSEQNRIVAKLEELMAYCDKLEASITASKEYNENLLQVLLRETLSA